MLRIAGQTTGPIGLKFLGHLGVARGVIGQIGFFFKNFFFKISFFNFFCATGNAGPFS